MKKKKIKKKKDKDLLKQINPANINIAGLKKANLKNTYINKIHYLMNEEDKNNLLRDSNSESE